MQILQEMSYYYYRAYKYNVSDYPLLVTASTSGICYMIGDLISQFIYGAKLSNIARMRILRSGAIAFCVHGPFSHIWYQSLERIDDVDAIFSRNENYKYYERVAFKLFLDQLIWTPFWSATYMGLNAWFKGEDNL